MNNTLRLFLLSVMLLVGTIVHATSKAAFCGYFDNDNKMDSVFVTVSEGSSATFFDITYVFSTLSRPIVTACTYNFSELLFFCPIPDVVAHRSKFVAQLAHELVPTAVANTDSNAMRWMDEVCANGNFLRDGYFDYKSHFSIKWGKPKAFQPSYAIMQRAAIACLLPDEDSATGSKTANSLVVYMANNHQGIVKTIATPGFNVLVTKHGVLLETAGKRAWVFINESAIFKMGTEKLRWASVTDVQISGDHLLINTIAIPSQQRSSFVICMKMWRLYRLSDYVAEPIAILSDQLNCN